MGNILSKILAIILGCLLLYIVPTYYTYIGQDDISKLVVKQAVVNFVDSVRNKGYISPAMYMEFESNLLASGNDYSIEMIHSKKRYDPVYDHNGNFMNDVMVNYDEYVTQDILKVLFPDNNWSVDDKRRLYMMSVGDFFYVKVQNINKTSATAVREFLTGSNFGTAPVLVVPYGGMVYNEDY